MIMCHVFSMKNRSEFPLLLLRFDRFCNNRIDKRLITASIVETDSVPSRQRRNMAVFRNAHCYLIQDIRDAQVSSP
jgi:hypothetical protein